MYPALAACGLVAGTINTVAGGGSFLTLPTLIFFGLDPTVANGTNRIGILLQNVTAVWGFSRHGVVERSLIPWTLGPALVGAGLGSWAALEVGDEAFRRILAALMVGVSLWTLWSSGKRSSGRQSSDTQGEAELQEESGQQSDIASTEGTEPSVLKLESGPTEAGSGAPHWLLACLFFPVGFYGGFVQAGAGFFILAATTLAGLDLVRGNAFKALLILAFTPIALGLFAASGAVEWGPGLAMAAGSIAGGWVGVRLTVLKGHRWVQRAVTAAVILFAVLLLRG